MSLYGNYIKELVNWGIIEDEKSFVTFQHLPLEVRIIDMYVLPEFRGKAKWKEMYNKIEETAKVAELKYISAVINKDIPKNNQERTKHLCSSVGMSQHFEDENFFIYRREL